MPYQCAFQGCNQEFRQASQLSLHRRQHANQESVQPVAVGLSLLQQELEAFWNGERDVPFTTLPDIFVSSNESAALP